jgi:hypothetical protein
MHTLLSRMSVTSSRPVRTRPITPLALVDYPRDLRRAAGTYSTPLARATSVRILPTHAPPSGRRACGVATRIDHTTLVAPSFCRSLRGTLFVECGRDAPCSQLEGATRDVAHASILIRRAHWKHHYGQCRLMPPCAPRAATTLPCSIPARAHLAERRTDAHSMCRSRCT